MTPSSLSQTDSTLDEGGRLLRVIVRPYPAKTAGIPLSFTYDPEAETFEFSFYNPAGGSAEALSSSEEIVESRGLRSRETEIFLPASLIRHRNLVVTQLTPQDRFTYDETRQTLFLIHGNMTPGHVHHIRVAFDPPTVGRRQSQIKPVVTNLFVIILSFIFGWYLYT